MSQFRRVAACASVGAVLVASGAVALGARQSAPRSGVIPGSNAQRFLALTDGARSGATTAAAATSRGKGGSRATAPYGSRPDCGSGPATPAGWCLTPAGTQYDVLRFPIGLTVDPTTGDAIVSSDGGGTQGIAVVNPNAPDRRAAVTFAPGANLFLGLSLSTSGTLYASGGNADRVFRYRLSGPAAIPEDLTQAIEVPTHNASNGLQARAGRAPQAAPLGDGVRVAGYPGESVVDDAHHLVFVGGTLSEPTGQGFERCGGVTPPSLTSACARVSVIDTTKENTGSDPVVRRVAVGADTYGLALDTGHHKLFVANWGDQAARGHGVGTVSVLPLDPSTGLPRAESKVIPVGHHPEALAIGPGGDVLYVTDTNDDTVTAISTASEQVIGVLDVGVAGHRVGTQPDALAVAPDGTKLFVALAGINAVQVIGLNPTTGLPSKDAPVSYVPTGWYPSAIAAVRGPAGHGTRLWVANAKGIGFGPGANGSVLFEGTTTGGTVSEIDLPAEPASMLRTTTKAVIANAGLDENPDPCDPALHPSPVLCPVGTPTSPIQHVVYIVVENKTFDSYFGDINSGSTKGYDASPGLVLFGQPVTTNQHAFVTKGVGALGDNFYSDAEVSVTGHSYASGALATDHNEKTWPADYDQGIRGTHGNGDPLRPSVGNPQQSNAIGNVENALYDPQGGFVFERFLAKGAVDPATKERDPSHNHLSMAIYGEHSTDRVGPEFHARGGTTDWKAGDIQYFDSCRAQLFVTGRVGGGNAPDTDQTRDCENRTLDPQFTLSHWESVYASNPSHPDVMPNFIYMSLPDNHTLGTNLGSPTPQSMVADNDYAIGTIVQALSQSPFWASTAVVIVQDDTQATGDHVNPLRDTLEVVSPWSATTPDHQRGSMGSVLRTIEMLFGVPPVGVNDGLAAPLHGAFVRSLKEKHSLCNDAASLGSDGRYAQPCYTAVRPAVPFAINQAGAPGQAASMAMDWSRVDQIDMATLNAIWWATQHHTAYKAPTEHPPSRDGDG